MLRYIVQRTSHSAPSEASRIHCNAPRATLPGPSRRITVEPLTVPVRSPSVPAPVPPQVEPREEPRPAHDPVPTP